jgi:DNA adenine methylase
MTEAPIFLKWPGGKRWASELISSIVSRFLAPKGTYFEPFLGGGSVFFTLRPTRAVLSDTNSDLIQVFQTIRDFPSPVVKVLRRMQPNEAEYYRIRASRPRSPVGKAAKFLFLNRTAFGGIYRVNKKGEFNVPYNGGDRDASILWKTSVLNEASAQLRGVEIVETDFESMILQAGLGDVIYCDPAYTVAHGNNGFIRYNERNFSWRDQERLVSTARKAVKRGATVIISNAHHRSIQKLYAGWTCLTLARQSRISPNPVHRRNVKESLFVLSPNHTNMVL